MIEPARSLPALLLCNNLISYDVQLRCRCTAEAALLLSMWERQLLVEDEAKATEKKGIRGAVRFAPELWTAALAIRRQQLQQLLTYCSSFAQRLKRVQCGLVHEALAPNRIAFGLARWAVRYLVRVMRNCGQGGCLRRNADGS